MSNNVMQRWSKPLINFILICVSCAITGGASFASPSTEGIQVYQKNLHLYPEHIQKLADDITRYRTADNLWDALRDDFSLPHYEDNPQVQEKIEWFMNNQDFLMRSVSRAAPYLYYISQQVKKRHLPAELVLLPIIESGYNPFSRSPAGAVGIWQLMPSTATGLGVKLDWWYDGRRDVIASTRAALNYFAYLQSFFEGNWLFAIAAYNTGEGNVLSAIKRNIREGADTNFWSLPLAQETRDYVPSLLALATIISHPERYPIYFPPVRNAPYLAQVDVGSQISLKYAAQLAGISYAKMQTLNPGFNHASISNRGPYKLILPIENVQQFTENLSRTPLRQQINWIHYKVKTGDTLPLIAKRFNTTTVAIRKLNHLTKLKLRHGASLLIPNRSNDEPEYTNTESSSNNNEVTITEAETPKHNNNVILVTNKNGRIQHIRTMPKQESISPNYSLQPGDTVYMVRNKDTIDKIAHRFHINAQTLMTANNLHQRRVKPGRQLIIPTHDHSASETASVAPQKNQLSPGDTIYMVRRGDTIERIASKFHTTPAAIRVANLMERSSLTEGERIIIPTHLRG